MAILPGAYSTQSVPRFGFRNRDIKGKERLVRITAGEPVGTITANPAYWTGTSIAMQASQYSQYLPRLLEIEYKPMVGTSVSGAITFGTAWHNDMPDPEAMLPTTPGGTTSALYTPFRVRIPLTGMSRKMYDMDTPLGPDSSPFSFMWTVSATDAVQVVGEIYITYHYSLFNMNLSQMSYSRRVMPASQALYDPDIQSATIVPLANMGPAGQMSGLDGDSISWLNVAVTIGSFIAQNFDPIKNICTWIYNRIVAAQTEKSADSRPSDGQTLVTVYENHINRPTPSPEPVDSWTGVKVMTPSQVKYSFNVDSGEQAGMTALTTRTLLAGGTMYMLAGSYAILHNTDVLYTSTGSDVFFVIAGGNFYATKAEGGPAYIHTVPSSSEIQSPGMVMLHQVQKESDTETLETFEYRIGHIDV